MPSNSELLRNAYDLFNRRQIDGVLALMSPDVDWPNALEGGRVHGHDGVRDYWTRQWSIVDPHVDPVRIEEAANHATVVHVHQVVRDLDGKLLLDQMVRHVYQFEDGLIARMDIQAAD